MTDWLHDAETVRFSKEKSHLLRLLYHSSHGLSSRLTKFAGFHVNSLDKSEYL